MSTCRWNGRGEPRTIAGRHEDDCADEETCRGCQPCTERHCRVCGVAHAEGACGECLAEVRDNLGEILRMCGGLLTEATHRGVEGEAMTLLGPVSNAEARQHWEASVLAGRITPMECDARDLVDVVKWLETADDERHPLLVIGTWSMAYRDAFEHDEPSGRVELANEVGYLSRNLTYMAGFEWVPFEDFARELRTCVGHLADVLVDSDEGERTNIDCLDCHGRLERKLGKDGFEDFATCRDCHRRYTGSEYNFAVTADLIERAEWLTDEHMAQRTGVGAATVRSWARKPKTGDPEVRKDSQAGRTVYAVADVEQARDTRRIAPCA